MYISVCGVCKHYGDQKTMPDALELEVQGSASHLLPALLLETKLCFVNHKISTCSSALSRLSSPYSNPPAISPGHPSAWVLAVAIVFFFILSHHFLDNLYGCLPDHQIFTPWDLMLLFNLFIHPFDLLFIQQFVI